MKKKLLIILFALFLGGTMALVTLHKFNFKAKTYRVAIYQLGIFKNYDNALKKAQDAKGAIIISNNENYQVIGAIASSKESQDKLANLLKNEQLDYYLKEIDLNEESKETIDEYELLINKTNDLEVLKKLNEELLKSILERMK